MSKIFISYVRSNYTVVDAVRCRLVNGSKDIINVFVDQDSIGLGEEWSGNIEDNIQKADVVLFFVGEAWLQSPNAKEERSVAETMGKRIIPIFLDDSFKTAEPPLPSHGVRLDSTSSAGLDAVAKKILESLRPSSPPRSAPADLHEPALCAGVPDEELETWARRVVALRVQHFGKVGVLVDDEADADIRLANEVYGTDYLPVWWVVCADQHSGMYAIDALREASCPWLVVVDRMLPARPGQHAADWLAHWRRPDGQGSTCHTLAGSLDALKTGATSQGEIVLITSHPTLSRDPVDGWQEFHHRIDAPVRRTIHAHGLKDLQLYLPRANGDDPWRRHVHDTFSELKKAPSSGVGIVAGEVLAFAPVCMKPEVRERLRGMDRAPARTSTADSAAFDNRKRERDRRTMRAHAAIIELSPAVVLDVSGTRFLRRCVARWPERGDRHIESLPYSNLKARLRKSRGVSTWLLLGEPVPETKQKGVRFFKVDPNDADMPCRAVDLLFDLCYLGGFIG